MVTQGLSLFPPPPSSRRKPGPRGGRPRVIPSLGPRLPPGGRLVARRLAPDLGEPRVPAAAPAIVTVRHRVLPVIILVVGLRGVERPGRQDQRGDRLSEQGGGARFG